MNSTQLPPLHPAIDDDNSVESESLDAHSMNMDYHPMDMKDYPTDVENLECFQEECEECGSNHNLVIIFLMELISAKNKHQ